MVRSLVENRASELDQSRNCTLAWIETRRPHLNSFTSETRPSTNIRVQFVISRLFCDMPPRRAASSKATSTRSKAKPAKSIAFERPEQPLTPALPPARLHSSSYHYPLLVDDQSHHVSLLDWFKSVEGSRTMPWRKTWVDRTQASGSDEETAQALNRRAYEVWVSEVSRYFNALDEEDA
jgi:hypothetical protein